MTGSRALVSPLTHRPAGPAQAPPSGGSPDHLDSLRRRLADRSPGDWRLAGRRRGNRRFADGRPGNPRLAGRRPGDRRRRRAIAALLAGTGVLLGYSALRPAPGTPVLVAARDLSPGVLRAGDLRLAPLHHPPDGAIRSDAVGRVLTGPMRRGEPLTDARLLHSLRLPPGTVATPVRISDADVARLISPGSTIGVLAAWEGQAAQLVADDVRVVTVPETDDGKGALVVLATTPAQAGTLAAAQAGGHLSITIKPG
ncbi:SAF domain-containing protein [Nonomuraea muscovyensis]|uniref:Flp pilus assembly protein CpaB n=1 Tax=Nonomuraea muscovyensis TaxID=1124761 RepID=UPI0033EBEE16